MYICYENFLFVYVLRLIIAFTDEVIIYIKFMNIIYTSVLWTHQDQNNDFKQITNK